ncbi:hypothetical protein ACIBKZ_23575 [Streptomyces sp. NPDC050421]|uniref:hypothetical protein n=1 Tax=unclassified Streptomyces TaxID=2593676 RepID=UPI0037B5D63E
MTAIVRSTGTYEAGRSRLRIARHGASSVPPPLRDLVPRASFACLTSYPGTGTDASGPAVENDLAQPASGSGER